mmetsp:Transcript_10049/g.23242  ORF Transcript_10049/g.23242 Transcript_10049/m.23242 type:complete len:82 (+) Transcript_10049:179-424(+)
MEVEEAEPDPGEYCHDEMVNVQADLRYILKLRDWVPQYKDRARVCWNLIANPPRPFKHQNLQTPQPNQSSDKHKPNVSIFS